MKIRFAHKNIREVLLKQLAGIAAIPEQASRMARICGAVEGAVNATGDVELKEALAVAWRGPQKREGAA
jgi:hypothetical protein